ncbi:MAG TPA: MoaD/ThiS family protein [Clostridia bacterium]|nr:MoaD/ThiS family protein [Clostridia bacterium]
MDELIEINIEYIGFYKRIAGKDIETKIISENAIEGIHEVKRYLREQYGIAENFMLIVNNESIIKLIKDKHRKLYHSDTFKVIPIISGG